MKFAMIVGAALATMSFIHFEASAQAKGQYTEVNGLKMYYEVHGSGPPLILLHGAFGTIDGWSGILPTLAKSRKVIAVELQGHGHTADIERPITMEQMADDTAGLLQQLKLGPVDVFGYSMGGSTALALAFRHPELVRKLVVLSGTAGSTKDTYEPANYQQMMSIKPENFNFPQMKGPYTKVAPDPSHWTMLVTKVLKLVASFPGFNPADVKGIKARTLFIQGDHDGVKVEHCVEMYRLVAHSQLAVIPGGDHFLVMMHPEKVLALLTPFLDAPVPED